MKKLSILLILAVLPFLSVAITAKVFGKGGVTVESTPEGTIVRVCPQQSNDECAMVNLTTSEIIDLTNTTPSSSRTLVNELIIKEFKEDEEGNILAKEVIGIIYKN